MSSLFSNLLPCAQLKSDLVKEVAYTRRKQHQASLQYYCALNALQYRKRIAMLEPMLGYTQAQVSVSVASLSPSASVKNTLVRLQQHKIVARNQK